MALTPIHSRRQFLQSTGLTALGILAGCRRGQDEVPDFGADLNSFLDAHLSEQRVVGFSSALIKGDRLLWSYAYGHADRDQDIAMTPDHIQNIGSVSKTCTATAVMQLWEEGHFQLDDDINDFLSFSVRNPRFPDEPVTFRQLLTHRSSITDGPSYEASYACGDPSVSLEDWITGYFTVDGAYYDAEANFHVWKPGTVDPPAPPRAYTNVGFGLLGYLVERIAGQPFNEFCNERIFTPLGMTHTGWHIREIDADRHSVLYTRLGDNPEPPEDGTLDSMLPADGVTVEDFVPNGFVPHCLYSFYNYPDGLVRTSVHELSRFLRAYALGGAFEGRRILKAETVEMMLSKDHFGQGLCWETYDLGGEDAFWGHDGGDPGVATLMAFRKSDDVGLVLFFNQGNYGDGIGNVMSRMIEEAQNA